MTSSKFNPHNLHFVMFPLMAPGHMIPIVDMSKLIAKHGITVSIITTPLNAARFKPTLDRSIEAEALDIRLCQLEFPTTDANIPEGCENIDMLPSLDLAYDFINAVSKLREPIETLLSTMQPRPSCIISDMLFSWTNEIAEKFNIPRIVFHGIGCFSLFCIHNLENSSVLRSVESEIEPFLIPDLPDRIMITKAKVPNSLKSSERYPAREKMRRAEKESFGIVVNSFHELEPEYFERCKEVKGKSVWCVGPVSLCSRDNLDKGDRGNKTAITRDQCLKWLDLQKPNSVIFACLGSLCNLDASQIMELAFGLEASNYPYIMALKEGDDRFKETEKLVTGKGLIIRGWAPQVLILSHSSVGGFLTHCGWNSTLEGLSAGVPMVTCPMFAEQFLNEEYVVQVLKVATKLRSSVNDGGEESEILEIKRDDVTRAVQLVMGDERIGKDMRDRAQRIGKMARKAVDEEGSSSKDMRAMIQQIIQQIEKRKPARVFGSGELAAL